MNLWLLYDGIFLLAGFYGISLCAKVSQSRNLADIRILMPRDVKLEECLDAEAFIKRILPWMILFSVTIILAGLASMAEDIGFGFPHGVKTATFLLCCVAAVAFFVFQRKAVDEFWEKEDEDE